MRPMRGMRPATIVVLASAVLAGCARAEPTPSSEAEASAMPKQQTAVAPPSDPACALPATSIISSDVVIK
ncbi:MAG: hypothetical protein ABI175_05075, partial [Polyangiales bacterium]